MTEFIGQNYHREAPVRLCCGERHLGIQCADGLVLCSLCFNKFPVEELHFIGGVREDVCSHCAKRDYDSCVEELTRLRNLLRERG